MLSLVFLFFSNFLYGDQLACLAHEVDGTVSCTTTVIHSEDYWARMELDVLAINCLHDKRYTEALYSCPGQYGCRVIGNRGYKVEITNWYQNNETREQAQLECNQVNGSQFIIR